MDYDIAFKYYKKPDITLDTYEICLLEKGIFSGEISIFSSEQQINYKAFKAFAYEEFIRVSLDINITSNDIKLLYEIDTRDLEGDYEGEIILKTCSKDFIIPVKITACGGYFQEECAARGIVINNFTDFSKTYENFPHMAVKLFQSTEFKRFLEDNYSEYVGLYEDISYNHKKDIALEVFMVAVGFKKPIKLYFENPNFKLNVLENQKLTGTLVLKKEGFGFINGSINFLNRHPAIKLYPTEFSYKDFDNLNQLYINYEIDSNKINSSFLISELKCKYSGGMFKHDFIIRKMPLTTVTLNKRAFRLSDDGEIIINNFGSEEIQGVVYSKDNYIKIDTKPHFIKDKLRISFKIKFSPFYLMTKNAIMKTEIFVKLGENESTEPIYIVNFNNDKKLF